MKKHLEAAAILSEIDGIRRRPEDRNSRLFQRGREPERRLATELHDDAEQGASALLDAHDLDNILGGQRLEIEPVGGIVIRGDSFRVAVDHDGLNARLTQAVGRVHAAVVKFDSLSDSIRSAAEDDNLAAVARSSFALGWVNPVPLVAGIHVWGE